MLYMDIQITLKCLIIQMEQIEKMYVKIKNEQLDFMPSAMIEKIKPPAV